MYTPDQYARAKAQFAGAPPEAQVILKERIGEYERYNPSHNAPSVDEPRAQDGEVLAPVKEAPRAPIEKLSHESDPSLAKATAVQNADAWNTREAAPDVEDRTLDPDLQTASHSTAAALVRKPEVVAANPLEGLKQIALATVYKGGLADGLLANSYYEPSEAQFQRDQGPLIEARGAKPGSEYYRELYNEYKDRKWAQAYDAAEAEGRPLTRMEYIHRDHVGWDSLKDTLANGADTAASFAKGFLNGRTLGAWRLTETLHDKLAGTDSRADSEAQVERHPWANMAGEVKGAAAGPLAEVTKGATPFSESTSMGARIAGAAIGGAVAGAGDDLTRAIGAGAEAAAHDPGDGSSALGRGEHSARDAFTSHLLGSALVGGGFGAAGHLVAEGANAWQKSVLGDTPELGQLRRGGGDTDLYRGIRPGKAVAENIEAAREPLPGENKVPAAASPVEVAVGKVRAPLAQAHTDLNAKTFERLGAEKEAAIAADPNLQKPVKASNAARAATDWVRSKLQPEVQAGYLPGMKLDTPQVTPGADVGEATKLVQQLYKPRLVTSVEAATEARANGGTVITAEEAQKLGIKLGDLAHEPAPETGVPHDAPPLDEGPVDIPKVLPRFPKGTDAGAVAADATPDEVAAIRRYTFGKRNPGDADLVNNYLERAPATPLPHVYRGIAMKPDQAAEMLASGEFNTGGSPASVSSNPTVARSFAARNREPGDVGLTFKLEGASARNIAPLAHEQVGVESELMLPARKQYQIVSKHPDPANPGDWIVIAKEVPSEPAAGSTTEEVFGRAADKPGATIDRLKPREGRAKAPPQGPVGSDWDRPEYDKTRFDYMYHDHAVKDPFPPPAGDDVTPTRPSNSPPFVERRAVSRGAPSAAPPELRATPSQQASAAQAAGVPASELKVVLEPREYDAAKFEEILGDIDRKAGYERANGKTDPQWEKLAQAIREDRKQFGPGWTDLIAKHHDELNQLEQRSFHAGMAEDKAYSEQQGGAQARLTGKLKGFPGDTDSQRALREIAASAPPEVQKDLEVLGAQNAYQKLKGQANPKVGETIGAGGIAGHLRGFGPAVKFRTDALARGLSAGPTGEPTITPRLAAFVRASAPGPKWLPGVPALGGGALGTKSAVAYDALTPQQREFLSKLVEHFKPGQSGVAQ